MSLTSDSNPTTPSTFVRALLTSRAWLLLTVCVATLIGASGILRIGFDTSLDALLTRSDPYLDEFNAFNEEFPQTLTMTAVFVPPEGQPAFSRSVLDAVFDLQTRYQELPSARGISTPINYFSPETRERLFERPYADYSDTQLQELGREALADRLLTNNLLTADGSLMFAVIRFAGEQADSGERMDLASAALALRDSMRDDYPDLGIHFSSEVLLEQSSQQAMIDDLTTLMPIVILVCVLVICYCFRSALFGLGILAHAIASLILTIGTLGFLGFAFNSISIIAPLVVVIIAVANSVHIISIYKQGLHQGQDRLAAMAHSLDYNLRPITLAALTTTIGFSSLNLCSSPAIQDFGRIVALGIAYAYVLTLTLLPALLILLTRSNAVTGPGDPPLLQRLLERVVSFSRRRDRPVFYGCTALALITLALLPLNETDFNRLDFITANSDIRGYYDVINDRINRGPQITYAIDTGRIDGAIEPEFLRRVEAYIDRIVELGAVESAASVADVVKTVNQVQHQEDPAYYRIPDDINDVANYLNGYETVQSEDFPLSGFINLDFSMITLFINATPVSNQELIDLDTTLGSEFDNFFEDATLVHGSGLLLFARMDELVTMELLQGYSLSLALITLSLVIGLRSLYFGVLSIIPNLLPATIVFGVWAVFVGQLDPFVMMLFSISIGLVVDDTVHILSHYLEGKQAGLSQQDAIARSIRVTGPALTITTLVLALGTTILIWANTLYFQQSAKLLVPIVVLALVLDLVYLPTILRRFDKSKASPATEQPVK
jgi:hypothetical protein